MSGWVDMPFFLPLTLSIFSPFIVTYWSDIMGGGGGVVVIGVSAVARLPHPYAWPPPLSQHVPAHPKLPLSRLTTDRPQPPNPSDIGSWGWIEWQSIVNTGQVVEGGGGSMSAEGWTSWVEQVIISLLAYSTCYYSSTYYLAYSYCSLCKHW